MSSTTSSSRGVLALLALLALLAASCHRTDADLEIDLRRGDGGFWKDTAGAFRRVETCSRPWRGEAPDDADAGTLAVGDCSAEQGGAHRVFANANDERDLMGVYLDGDFGVRVFWYALGVPYGCWALEVERPAGERLHVTLPPDPGRILTAPDCVPPKCQIRPCK